MWNVYQKAKTEEVFIFNRIFSIFIDLGHHIAKPDRRIINEANTHHPIMDFPRLFPSFGLSRSHR